MVGSLFFAWPGWGQPLSGQFSTRAETGTAIGSTGEIPQQKLCWHDTLLLWDHSATAQTIGIGSDYQSRNPLYEMSFLLRPRWYLLDNPSLDWSLRAEVGALREFTNSDVTTRRGEWSATDWEVSSAVAYRWHGIGASPLVLGLRAPIISLPTSHISWNNGKWATVGGAITVSRAIPLMGKSAAVFRAVELVGLVQYGYLATRAVVPVNADFERIRMGLDGRAVPTDQLDGAAVARHQLMLGLIAGVDLAERWVWETTVVGRLAWKYPLNQAQLCGVIDTGCAQVGSVPDPQTYSLLTLLRTQVTYALSDELGLGVGYLNVANQLGRDGQRRLPFYSPESRIMLTFSLRLDQLYLRASAGRLPAQLASSR